MFEKERVSYQKTERYLKNWRTINNFKSVKELFSGHDDLIDLLQKCLQIDPNRRINCKNALQHPFFQVEYQWERKARQFSFIYNLYSLLRKEHNKLNEIRIQIVKVSNFSLPVEISLISLQSSLITAQFALLFVFIRYLLPSNPNRFLLAFCPRTLPQSSPFTIRNFLSFKSFKFIWTKFW